MSLTTKAFFDNNTFTITYIVYDQSTKDAVIIDPVLDYDSASSKISYQSIDKIIDYINEHNLNTHYILETHAHADHLTGAAELKKKIPKSKVAIGKNITQVQDLFAGVFNLSELPTDGSQFDILLTEEETLEAGSVKIKTIFTPGHTPACSSFLIDDMVFTGDSLFMPDYGTGRCDFPAGDAKELYNSVHNKLYALPDETKVMTGHDYCPGGREVQFQSTIGESKKSNIHLRAETSENEFVHFREARDASLAAPKLLLPSIQLNINAGALPKAESNGVQYFKMPIKK